MAKPSLRATLAETNTPGATLSGTPGADLLAGTAGDDWIDGLAGDDGLQGLDGDDRLDGGSGADLLQGGIGHDSYVVEDAGDRVREASGAGRDVIHSSLSWSLAGQFVEDLLLTGRVALQASGNSLSNQLTGNRLANLLLGLGGDDRLDGGLGADRMEGGLGHDTYVVDDPGDRVVEASGEGTDTVISGIDYSLAGQFLENLTLAGGALLGSGNSLANSIAGNALDNRLEGLGGDDRLSGGDGRDRLLGGTGADRLEGGAGDDELDGGPGADGMVGGPGNDVFHVDDAGDRVVETSPEGQDIVYSSVGFSLAGGFVNDLVLTGFADLEGRGSGTANRIAGNAGDNRLLGGGGNDRLEGGAGDDRLEGGAGADRLLGGDGADLQIGGPGYDILDGGSGVDSYRILAANDGYDTLLYQPGEDYIEISAAAFGGGLLPGMDLAQTGYFLAGATAPSAAHGQFIWAQGVLSFDANGTDPGGLFLVARFVSPLLVEDLAIIA